jgi:hypothetical protein
MILLVTWDLAVPSKFLQTIGPFDPSDLNGRLHVYRCHPERSLGSQVAAPISYSAELYFFNGPFMKFCSPPEVEYGKNMPRTFHKHRLIGIPIEQTETRSSSIGRTDTE